MIDLVFDVLAVPCDRAFVTIEKTKEFKNQTNSLESRALVKEKAETFKVNNLVDKGHVLKK